MNIPMVTLAAFMAIFPLSSVAGVPCTLNGDPVPGDPELIEGTGSADIIDCSESSTRHDIYGYGGDDKIYGSPFDDFIAGGSGKDTLHGGNGDDAIDGGGDDDTIWGEGGDDIIFGGVGASPASGVGCELQFKATGSSYLTKGGSGDDLIYGGDGNDCINAGSGEDVVFGEDGNDTIEGGNHSDVLHGGPGVNYIDGGWHTDTCIGDTTNTFISCETIDICNIDCGAPPFCGDNICDASEEYCSCPVDCGTPPLNETSCTNNFDDDCDFFVDCNDLDCSIDETCQSCIPGAEICDNGLDEDCDNQIDCDDIEDCGSNSVCINSCFHLGFSCISNLDCCSNKCRGKPGSKTCK